jgi:very-short-patch-repair endonuclease
MREKNRSDPRIVIPGWLRKEMIEAARLHRKNPTRSEYLLWQALRGKKLAGIKFRRQHPIGPWIVDFYAPACRLVVEVDGPVHDTQWEADQIRQDLLERLGLRFLRISSELVERDLEASLEMIRMMIDENPLPQPDPRERVA